MVYRILVLLLYFFQCVLTQKSANDDEQIRDGPSPSIIGSIDNVFKSVKDYDSNHCIERMVCEYMMPKIGDDSLLGGSSSQPKPIRGGVPFGPQPFTGQFPPNNFNGQTFQTQDPNFQNGFPPPQQFNQFANPSFQNGGGQFPPQGFSPQQFGNQQFAPPNQFGGRPQGFPPIRGQQQQGILGLVSGLIGKKKRRRRKRQTNLQGNILRLLKATGLDSMNAFPYIRAGLIGQAADPSERGGNSCSRMYRECPTEPDRLLSYFNNHNGGIINNVQPSVDNEIGPIVSAIISDIMEENGSTEGGGGIANSGLIASAGNFLSSYLSGSNSGGSSSGGASGLLSSFVGNGGGETSGVLSSLLQSETGLINGAVNAITDYIHGPGLNGKK